jgi:hypothetical protein
MTPAMDCRGAVWAAGRDRQQAAPADTAETKAPGSETTKMAKTQGVATGVRCGRQCGQEPRM